MDSPLYYVFTVAYVVMFLVFAARLPRVALALCFGLSPIQRALPGLPAHVAIADLNLTLTFVVFCFQKFSMGQRIRWGPVGIYCALYLVVCFISSVADWRGEGTIVCYLQMIPYLVFAPILFSSYGKSLEDLKPAFMLLIGVGLFFSVSVILTFSPFIYGMHKNGMGSSLATASVMEVELWLAATDPRKKKLIFYCLVPTLGALMITLSRGAWMGLAAGIITILSLRRDVKSLLRFCIILIPLITVGWILMPSDDKSFASGFDASRRNVHDRLVFVDQSWEIFKNEPILGAGLGLRKEMDALDVVLMCLAETGIVGLFSFMLIHYGLIRMSIRANQRLNINSWAFSCLSIGTAVMICKLAHSLVDHYWSRGCITIAWAGLGIATRAFYVSQGTPDTQVAIPQLPRIISRRRRRIPSNHRLPWPAPGTNLPPQS